MSLPSALEEMACRFLAKWLCEEVSKLRADPDHDPQAVIAPRAVQAEGRSVVWEPSLFVRVWPQAPEVQGLLRFWSNRPARIVLHASGLRRESSRKYRVVLLNVLERACSHDAELLSQLESDLAFLARQTGSLTERYTKDIRVTNNEIVVWGGDDDEGKEE